MTKLEPDWEPHAGEGAHRITKWINAEFAERNLLPLTNEAAFVVQQAFATAIIQAVRAGIDAATGKLAAPEPLDLDLARCQVCYSAPVIVRWHTTEGPINLCAGCDRSRVSGGKLKRVKK